MLAVPHRPEDIEQSGDDQDPEEGRDERANERADVTEGSVLVAVQADRGPCRHLADGLPALGVADRVVQSGARYIDDIRERVQQVCERSAAAGEDREAEAE